MARAETVDPLVTGREFGEWVELILDTCPLSRAALVASACGTLLTSILKLFNSILTALVTLVKKSLHTFLALSAFEGLLSLQKH